MGMQLSLEVDAMTLPLPSAASEPERDGYRKLWDGAWLSSCPVLGSYCVFAKLTGNPCVSKELGIGE